MTQLASPAYWLRKTALTVFALAPLLPQPAAAAETVTYSYDALGRLIKTVRIGGPASGVDASTQYDPAGNRTNVTVGGARSNIPPTSSSVIVVPLDGFSIVAIGGAG
jgi:YD repeat-containing protein